MRSPLPAGVSPCLAMAITAEENREGPATALPKASPSTSEGAGGKGERDDKRFVER